jgi:hypothetical protein
MTQDRIEQETVIAASVERVWAVLTEPEHVGRWFGQGKPTQVDLRPGGDGTRLHLVESGFASLTIPPGRIPSAGYESHLSGWPQVLGELRSHAERAAA